MTNERIYSGGAEESAVSLRMFGRQMLQIIGLIDRSMLKNAIRRTVKLIFD